MGRGGKQANGEMGLSALSWRSALLTGLLGAIGPGLAVAQSITGTTAEIGDVFTIPDSDFAIVQGIAFRIRVLDGASLALSLPQEFLFSYRFSLFRAESDLSLPVPAGAVVEELASEQWIFDGGTVLPFQVSVQNGEDLTLILICQAFCSDQIYAYGFDLIGAVLLTYGPEPEAELDSLVSASSGMDRLVVLDAQRVARDMGTVSLAARKAAQAAGGGTVSSKSGVMGTPGGKTSGMGLGGAGLAGEVHSWVRLTGFDSTADSGPGAMSGNGFQLGADLALGADMVAGLSLGHANLNATDGSTGQTGGLTFLQPYAAWNPGAWHGHASLIYGRGEYDQTSISGAGTGETDLLALTVEGGFDHPLAPGLTLTPSIGLITGRQTVTGTGGTLAGAGQERVDFTQTSMGARLTYQRRTAALFAGVHADYLTQDSGAVLTEGFLSETGWTGRVALGGSFDLRSGDNASGGTAPSLDVGVELGGLGGAAQTLSGGLQLSLRF